MKGIKRIESLNENASDKHPKTNQIQSLVSILKLKKEEIFLMFRNRAMQENLINNAPAPIEEGRGDCHFMFIPGTRNDRVVLVAHADTVWDEIENFPPTLANSNGCIYSENKKRG
ncbi:hypothetical protein GF340_04255 [Candidatus Peregrinibacteria bacterium]|nr:hypothetical protein [Candidatus Peregrinibacteria bacterium]